MSATNQVHPNKLNPPNKQGKGGFGDNPDHRSPGGWKKENVLSYQYKRFLNMSLADFEAFAKTPKDKMTMAEYGGYSRVAAMRKSLPDAKEIADRTEGRAAQAIDVTSDGKALPTPILGGLSMTGLPDVDNQAK